MAFGPFAAWYGCGCGDGKRILHEYQEGPFPRFQFRCVYVCKRLGGLLLFGGEETAMNITLRPEMQKFVEEQVKAGYFATPEEVVEAGVARLMLDPVPDSEGERE